MATVGILKDTAKLKRLVDIMASRMSLYTVEQRITMLTAAGLSFFISTIELSGDASQFAHTLIRATEQRGNLPNQNYPSLVNLLYYLRDEVLGDDEDRWFIIELLIPYIDFSTVLAPLQTELVLSKADKTPAPIPPTPAAPAKHTILFLAANPLQYPGLNLADEVRMIGERLRQGSVRDKFELESEWAVQRRDLSERLLRHTPTIVHFAGHGQSDLGVVLQDEAGNPAEVGATALAGLFRIVRESVAPHLNLVVFNICWSKSQAEALKTIGITHVIGMNATILDKAAQVFAAGFYRGMGFGLSVPNAFALGCNELELEYPNNPELAKIPQLI